MNLKVILHAGLYGYRLSRAIGDSKAKSLWMGIATAARILRQRLEGRWA